MWPDTLHKTNTFHTDLEETDAQAAAAVGLIQAFLEDKLPEISPSRETESDEDGWSKTKRWQKTQIQTLPQALGETATPKQRDDFSTAMQRALLHPGRL